ncbi:glycoside hydrolase family 3 N-terminal domain-containing protein [Spirillospora sp. CA-255316]
MSWSEEDITKLVSRLTLEQKVAQLGGAMLPALLRPDPEAGAVLDTGRLAERYPHGVGHLSLTWFVGHDADGLRSSLRTVQDAVRDLSPFGIGGLIHIEGINGFLHASGSQFPTAWAQAATWEPDLVRRAAAVTAAHMHDAGIQLVLSPVMDISRDPRWGRVHETYGEDPELAAQFSVAFVRAVQASGLLATGKHFLGFAASEGGLNMAATRLGRRALTDEYAEPFRRAIGEAGLSVVMNSYNEIDGVPAAADRWLLTDLLRGELGFTGLVVSDYGSVDMLRTRHRTAASEGRAAVQAVTAGLDVELPQLANYAHLVAEVAAGNLDEQVVDTAVARVLTAKARVGLIPAFTPRGSAPRTALADAQPARPDRAEAARLRRSIAERATVLLGNDGTLPLRPGTRRIVVTGPAADGLRVHFGAYTSVAVPEMTMALRAVRQGEIAGVSPEGFDATDITRILLPGLEPAFEANARRLHPGSRTVLAALREIDATIEHADLGRFTEDAGPALDPAAVEAAVSGADLVIAVVGERTGRVGANTAGEGRSTASPSLPGDQERLIALLAATGKPLVTVVVSGRPLLLEEVAGASNAVLLAPLLGEEAGAAIADAVFGRINPSGKLPATFPRHLGQIPIYHGHHHGSGYDHPAGAAHDYADLDDQTPLYAFGHGLSYTSFEVEFDDEPAVDVVGGALRVRLRVSNTGALDGEAVVQLYARHQGASVVRPVRRLLQFQRVALTAGDSMLLILMASIERLSYTMLDGRRGLEPGEVTVMAGMSSDDIRCAATISVPGPTNAPEEPIAQEAV